MSVERRGKYWVVIQRKVLLELFFEWSEEGENDNLEFRN